MTSAHLGPIFVVDDEPAAVSGMELVLLGAGYPDVVPLTDPRRVLDEVSRRRPACILLDLSMPHIDGRDLLATLHDTHADIPVVVVTGYNDVETAVSCMRAGAFDYLVKPVDAPRLVTTVERALTWLETTREYARFRQGVLEENRDHLVHFSGLVTGCPRMVALLQYAAAVAPSPRPVLIVGESGTGKELVARGIHRASGRKGPFVAVNVAGLDDHVLNDTLFGHVKGAFTGADTQRDGLVAKAAGGTLFLDEIGDLGTSAQTKLLRLLQEGEYYPVGSDRPVRASARIVAATNADLAAAKDTGTFRADLYYRLCAHLVRIPPLRERTQDIPALLDHLVRKAAATLDKPLPTLPPQLVQLLQGYHFPGNVRELEALVFDAVAQHRKGILSTRPFRDYLQRQGTDTDGAPAQADTPTVLASLPILPTLRDVRALLVREALRRADGNHTIAAQMLGVTRSAISKWLARHGAAD